MSDPIFSIFPSVRIPNNVGAQGISRDDSYFHKYKVTTPNTLRGPEASKGVGEGIANKPVPIPGQRATREGARNNAGALPGWLGDVNMVKSFLVASPDTSKYTDITVNYTIAGEHSLGEGFVMRLGLKGPGGTVTPVSYGEGNSFYQNESSLWKALSGWPGEVEKVWQKNQQEIIKDVIQLQQKNE